jgi:hypothetical protein
MSYRQILNNATLNIPPDVVRYIRLVDRAERTDAPHFMQEQLAALEVVGDPEAQRDPLVALLHLMDQRHAFDDRMGRAMAFLFRCFGRDRDETRFRTLRQQVDFLLTGEDLIAPPQAFYKLLLEQHLRWFPWVPGNMEASVAALEQLRLRLLERFGADAWVWVAPLYSRTLRPKHGHLLHMPRGPMPGHEVLGAYIAQLFPQAG